MHCISFHLVIISSISCQFISFHGHVHFIHSYKTKQRRIQPIKPTNRSTNQSINQSIKQSINQSIESRQIKSNQVKSNQLANNQATSQPTKQTTNHKTNQQTHESTSQPTKKSINQSISLTVSQPVTHRINESTSTLASTVAKERQQQFAREKLKGRASLHLGCQGSIDNLGSPENDGVHWEVALFAQEPCQYGRNCSTQAVAGDDDAISTALATIGFGPMAYHPVNVTKAVCRLGCNTTGGPRIMMAHGRMLQGSAGEHELYRNWRLESPK